MIANELRLDLYRVDLARLVSKYIGETEKNLARVFEAATASGAIILFDEADALFGKRSEVRDSHDRYANIEVSYLLQRIETYRGLSILTTNLKPAIDPAFLRRFRFIVQFPFPDATARREIWSRVFPTALPTSALDTGSCHGSACRADTSATLRFRRRFSQRISANRSRCITCVMPPNPSTRSSRSPCLAPKSGTGREARRLSASTRAHRHAFRYLG